MLWKVRAPARPLTGLLAEAIKECGGDNLTLKKPAIVAVVLASLLSGCTMGPKYVRPAVKAPDGFRGSDSAAPPSATTSSATTASLGDLKWFEVFQDDKLQGLIRTALVQNYDLQDAAARVFFARADLGIARSNEYPQIGSSEQFTSSQFSTKGQYLLPPNL